MNRNCSPVGEVERRGLWREPLRKKQLVVVDPVWGNIRLKCPPVDFTMRVAFSMRVHRPDMPHSILPMSLDLGMGRPSMSDAAIRPFVDETPAFAFEPGEAAGGDGPHFDGQAEPHLQ